MTIKAGIIPGEVIIVEHGKQSGTEANSLMSTEMAFKNPLSCQESSFPGNSLP